MEASRPRGVGVDPNETAITVCRQKGHEAYTPEEFAAARPPDGGRTFDMLLCSHVLEHLDEATGVALLESYLPNLRDDGRIVLITPQERGQRSDPTHVRYMDAAALESLAGQCHLTIERTSSFPLPRSFGKWFIYNETITVARIAR